MTGLVEVLVGVVGRAHGIRGDAFVDMRVDESGRRSQPGSGFRLMSRGRPVPERIHWYRERPVISPRGCLDKTVVETLRSGCLFVDVPADEIPSELEEYFDRQLIRLHVLGAENRWAGEVAEVLHLPAQDCLAVETSSGGRLVPSVSTPVTRADLATGEVQSANVGGLLEESE